MGVFSRFKDIVNANLNAILDDAENPEKMIRLMIREMEDTLVDLKASCAEKMALQVDFERQLEEQQERLLRWETRARMAVEKNKDELAREALREKKICSDRIDSLKGDQERQQSIVDETRESIIKLESKLTEAWQKHKILISRSEHANDIKRGNKTLRRAGNEAAARFAEFEQKIERIEAEAELSGIGSGTSNEVNFRDMEMEEDIERELAELKGKNGSLEE